MVPLVALLFLKLELVVSTDQDHKTLRENLKEKQVQRPENMFPDVLYHIDAIVVRVNRRLTLERQLRWLADHQFVR